MLWLVWREKKKNRVEEPRATLQSESNRGGESSRAVSSNPFVSLYPFANTAKLPSNYEIDV